MSIKLMTQVWDHSVQRGTDLLMLLTLADHANDEGKCWPSLPRLATRCRVTKRQAITIIHRLETQGVITIVRGGGRHHVSIYTVKGEAESTVAKGEAQHETVKSSVETVKSSVETVKSRTPEPSLEPPQESKEANPDVALAVGEGKTERHEEGKSPADPADHRPPRTDTGKRRLEVGMAKGRGTPTGNTPQDGTPPWRLFDTLPGEEAVDRPDAYLATLGVSQADREALAVEAREALLAEGVKAFTIMQATLDTKIGELYHQRCAVAA